MGRAVEREEITTTVARRAALRIIKDGGYSVNDAFQATVQVADFAHATAQLAGRLITRIEEHEAEGYPPTDALRETLQDLTRAIRRLLRG